jgi:hypothetical protein
VRGPHWHDLRHTFGTRLAEAGCSEATISELMGHTDPKTTRRYTHGTDRAKRQAVEAARPRAEEEGTVAEGGEPARLTSLPQIYPREKMAGGGGRKPLKILVAGGRLELPTLGL